MRMGSPQTPEEAMEPYKNIRIGGIATSCGNAPVDAPLFSEIIPDLWTGGSVAEWYKPMTPYFQHILNLYPWMPYQVPYETNYMELRMLDGHHIDEGFITKALEFVADAFDNGVGPVLIHCQAGINRSNLVAASAMVRLFGFSSEEAISIIRTKRCATALCNPTFEAYVRSLDA
jgi:hypothetical protein